MTVVSAALGGREGIGTEGDYPGSVGGGGLGCDCPVGNSGRPEWMAKNVQRWTLT